MKRIKQDLPALPILAYLIILVGIPLLLVVVLSFLSRDNLGNIVFEFTLDNYKKMFDSVYLKVFLNSFSLAGLTGLITLLIGYPVAYFTASLGPKNTLPCYYVNYASLLDFKFAENLWMEHTFRKRWTD